MERIRVQPGDLVHAFCEDGEHRTGRVVATSPGHVVLVEVGFCLNPEVSADFWVEPEPDGRSYVAKLQNTFVQVQPSPTMVTADAAAT